MNLDFRDLQEPDNSMNGRTLSTAPEVESLFESLAERDPFLFELCGSNGFVLTIGLANGSGTVQHSSIDGSPPHYMAISNAGEEEDGYIEFLAGNTPTPIPRRFCLPIEQVQEIAVEFLLNEAKSESVRWEAI